MLTRHAIATLLLLAAATSVHAAGADTLAVTTKGEVEHEWLYGAGRANVLDTYLSPLEYTGAAFTTVHRSRRTARWGKGRVSVQGYFTGHAAYLSATRNDHKEWDADVTAAVAWHRNWTPAPRLTLAAGGMAEIGSGFTYNTGGGNNPAQGRLWADAALSLAARYDFTLLSRSATVTTQADVPLIGAAFSPQYGQSYYELFSLGHYDHNVRLTTPLNAPSLRWLTTLRWNVLGATLSVGYMADIRQTRLNSLKRHAWHNAFVIGYVRRLRLLR